MGQVLNSRPKVTHLIKQSCLSISKDHSQMGQLFNSRPLMRIAPVNLFTHFVLDLTIR